MGSFGTQPPAHLVGGLAHRNRSQRWHVGCTHRFGKGLLFCSPGFGAALFVLRCGSIARHSSGSCPRQQGCHMLTCNWNSDLIYLDERGKGVLFATKGTNDHARTFALAAWLDSQERVRAVGLHPASTTNTQSAGGAPLRQRITCNGPPEWQGGEGGGAGQRTLGLKPTCCSLRIPSRSQSTESAPGARQAGAYLQGGAQPTCSAPILCTSHMPRGGAAAYPWALHGPCLD